MSSIMTLLTVGMWDEIDGKSNSSMDLVTVKMVSMLPMNGIYHS